MVAFPSSTLLSLALNSSALLAVPLGGPGLGDWGLELEMGMGPWQEVTNTRGPLCRTRCADALQVVGGSPSRSITFTFHFHALEEEMATHSSVLAWRIPGTGEPGRRPSMGSHRVGHD